jgi:hypothetical protein
MWDVLPFAWRRGLSSLADGHCKAKVITCFRGCFPATRRAFPAFVAKVTIALINDPYISQRRFHKATDSRVFLCTPWRFVPEFATGGVAIDSTRAIGAEVPGVHFAIDSLSRYTVNRLSFFYSSFSAYSTAQISTFGRITTVLSLNTH